MTTQVTADDQIEQCMNAEPLQSFFLLAGAGSGKTRSLVEALLRIRANRGDELRSRGAQVAVITYTRAATNEIQERLGHDALVHVSTIHSFAWELIRTFTTDIRAHLEVALVQEIAELREAEAKGRAGTKASQERILSIARKIERLERLPHVREFLYNPNQTSLQRDGLTHSEVVKIAATFLTDKPLFQKLLIGRFPIVLVDEVQDTNAALMDALLATQLTDGNDFCLGLFGDTMQRVYADGKEGLSDALDGRWTRPRKDKNYRSRSRIVELVGIMRRDHDDYTQESVRDGGHAHLFVASHDATERATFEADVRSAMAAATEDDLWREPNEVKTLILEHAMAASRLHFQEFFDCFQGSTLRSSITSKDATSSGNVHFLGSQVVPLARAVRANDTKTAERVLRQHSPQIMFDPDAVVPRVEVVANLRSAMKELSAILAGPAPTLREVLEHLQTHQTLQLPSQLADILTSDRTASEEDPGDPRSEFSHAWSAAFDVQFEQFERYYDYISGVTAFDTHQGVKGLEFPRVMVVLDDHSAGGFLFSYEKLLKAKPPSPRDQQHLDDGTESTFDRTLRLLYVACSRAEESLAIVVYTSDVAAVRRATGEFGWFTEDEVHSAGVHA